jgi:hypothetical protein
MAKRLLDRQASLLAYLTSGATIFGERGAAPADRSLEGIDRSLLRLEARFSHEKRMEKIAAVFPKTFALLGSAQAATLRQFVKTCPPVAIGRLENARQFLDFLRGHRRRSAAQPPYLRDVAACELAVAQVRASTEDREPNRGGSRKGELRGRMRRQPGIVLLRCAHDIRPIFEAEPSDIAPVERDMALVVAMPPGATRPQVFEVLPAVFDLLGVLDDWTDPSTFGRTTEIKQLIRELTEYRLIEVRG